MNHSFGIFGPQVGDRSIGSFRGITKYVYVPLDIWVIYVRWGATVLELGIQAHFPKYVRLSEALQGDWCHPSFSACPTAAEPVPRPVWCKEV